MKKYFVSCKSATETRLLWQLQERQHFMENVDSFSLQDLVDVNSGELLDYLRKVQAVFIKHIKEDCTVSAGYTKVLLCCMQTSVLIWQQAWKICLKMWFVLYTLHCRLCWSCYVVVYLQRCMHDIHCG